jgi:hypothetical protein
MYYLFLLGPYDSTVVGPYPSLSDAKLHRLAIIKTWKHDALVWTKAEYDANVAEFGPIEVVAPKEYES